MLIYSLAPIDWSTPAAPEAGAVRCQPYPGGFLEGVDGPQGFTVRRVISTDPAAYLSPTLAPGAVYHPPKGR